MQLLKEKPAMGYTGHTLLSVSIDYLIIFHHRLCVTVENTTTGVKGLAKLRSGLAKEREAYHALY